MLASIFYEDAECINVTGLWWHNRESIFKAHNTDIVPGKEAHIIDEEGNMEAVDYRDNTID